MKSRLICLLLLLCGTTACLELGSDTEKATPKTECQVISSNTSFSRYGSNYSYNLIYTFNSAGLLTHISSPDTSAVNIRFGYDAQQRLITEQFASYTWTSTYNEQGQLAKQTRSFEVSEGRFEIYFLEHYYNLAGKLAESRYYAQEPNGDVLLYTYHYSYTDGKMSGIEKLSAQDSRHYKATFTTDDRKKPLPSLSMHLLFMFRDEHLPVMGILPGNITSFTNLQATDDPDFEAYTTNITYNDAGYPTTIVKTYAGGGTERTVYTYSCR
ncbi:hypothetical protein [Pontibacter fetidus]|uniref:YD repeat-containing protein n=1 Tax=Pontibacter fetidus TaxID=2700082 RepID=A0A6B2H0G8_9BACT|nr:hypothetical protein [Pontibacter fetidus]NDK55811.1 hypothetical protein [Pontibacter fetidus]